MLTRARQSVPRTYRRTVLDRLGPRSEYVLKALGWAAFGALLIVPVAFVHSPFGWSPLVTAPICFLLTWIGLFAFALALARPAGAVADFYLLPTGDSTPYAEQFSQEEALLMQNRMRDALELYERRIARDPAAVAARIRAAELYAGEGHDPRRAATLFREAQRIPGLTSGDDLYVGNRLADLYLGPLGEPERALVELRRLLVRYPDSRVAPQLREALHGLKSRLNLAEPSD